MDLTNNNLLYCSSNNINLVYMPMAYNIKGTSTCNEDGSYTIIINSKIPESQHLEVYLHELEHINNGDFMSDNVDLVEKVTHLRK